MIINSKKVIYEKEGTKLEKVIPICECGGEMFYAFHIGCIHEDGQADVFQCGLCKSVGIPDWSQFSRDIEQLGIWGWKRVSPEKSV